MFQLPCRWLVVRSQAAPRRAALGRVGLRARPLRTFIDERGPGPCSRTARALLLTNDPPPSPACWEHAAPPAEREREATELIRSNGGRWKFSDEMVRALKVRKPCGEAWTVAVPVGLYARLSSQALEPRGH